MNVFRRHLTLAASMTLILLTGGLGNATAQAATSRAGAAQAATTDAATAGAGQAGTRQAAAKPACPVDSPSADRRSNDHTHFEAAGARQIAAVIATALREQGIPLAAYLRTAGLFIRFIRLIQALI